MNQNEPSEDRGLRRALTSWQVSSSLSPRFQQGVWAQIAAAEARPGLWERTLARLDMLLPRPAVALGYVVLLLFLGLGAGWWQAQEASSRFEQTLAQRYVQAVDPYQK